MPPSVREWVPEGHLVWTVLDAVGELDLSAFYAVYRADGHGRPAYEPSMMMALLMYAYAREPLLTPSRTWAGWSRSPWSRCPWRSKRAAAPVAAALFGLHL